MALDKHVSAWILEFILRQPFEDWVINGLLSILSPPDDNLFLKRSVLLVGISSKVSKGLISETILEWLEMIEEIDYREGSRVLDSMKIAYDAVAVECAVKFLREKPEDFSDAIDRIWNPRIADTEKFGGTGLISDRFRSLRKEMESAATNPRYREEILRTDCHQCALDLLGVFLEDTRREMGPSFLEIAAKALNEGELGLLQADKERHLVQNAGMDNVDEYSTCSDDARGAFAPLEEVETGKTLEPPWIDLHSRRTPPIEKRVLVQGCDHDDAPSEEMDVSRTVEEANGRLRNKYDCLLTPYVNQVQEALRISSVNLQTVVEDPLPGALIKTAARIEQRSPSATIQANQEVLEGNQGQSAMDLEATVEKGIEVIQVEETNARNPCGVCQGGVVKRSLMDRNHTARTFEWDDDSIESPSENSPNSSREIRLPTPKERAVSPLKHIDLARFVRRRRIKRWSSIEEETLRKAVHEHGQGNWKFILKRYPEIFEERTEVDLKDKWRNMMRS